METEDAGDLGCGGGGVGDAVVGADDEFTFRVVEMGAGVGDHGVGVPSEVRAAEVADDAVEAHLAAHGHFLKGKEGGAVGVELGDGDLALE